MSDPLPRGERPRDLPRRRGGRRRAVRPDLFALEPRTLLSADFLTGPADGLPLDIVKGYLARSGAAYGVDPADVDLVIVANCTHHMQTPGASSEVEDRLGLTKAGAMDLNAACAGFAYTHQSYMLPIWTSIRCA